MHLKWFDEFKSSTDVHFQSKLVLFTHLSVVLLACLKDVLEAFEGYS